MTLQNLYEESGVFCFLRDPVPANMCKYRTVPLKIITKYLIAALLTMSISRLEAAPTLSKSTYSMIELDNSVGSFTTYGGLTQDGDILYYSNFDTVRRYDLLGATNSVYAQTSSNADTKGLAVIGSTMYLAMDTSYSAPYPSNLGTIDPATGFSVTLQSGTNHLETTYSIYDAAVYNDAYYFVANPGTINTNEQQGPTGSRIYRYNTADPNSPNEIANIGGSSGGIAFDTEGNLYYASQNSNEGILRFEAGDVQSGGLNAADGITVANVVAGFMSFLPTGELVATTGWGASLDVFDTNTGNKLRTIATASYPDSISKFAVDGSILYILNTNWNEYKSSLLCIDLIEPEGYASWITDYFPIAYPGDDADSDNDGHSNYAEFVAGTSPTDKDDVLTINIEMVNGEPNLTWSPNLPNRSYTLQGRTSFATGLWGATNLNSRFFRVKVELAE